MEMMRGSQNVADVLRHFDSTAGQFDAIYSSTRLVDRIFRRDRYDRFQRTVEQCEPIRGKSVLAVGCGSGQYAIALAQRGAGEVVGLDFAQHMLDIAEEKARRAGVADRCRFIRDEFLAYPSTRRFDYVLAIGFFDYVRDPVPFLARARDLTGEKFVATFPRLFTWRAPVRKVRLTLRRCPVFFYSRARVAALMHQAGLAVDLLDTCGQLYFVAGAPANARRTRGGGIEDAP